MLENILDVLKDTTIDCIKLIPFLFITYLIMEYIEHKTSEKTKETIKKSGKLGPIIGSIVGIFPQCGFSVSAANLYAARVISLGTLISVYLTTSDEMIPIFISEAVPIDVILKILGIKLVIGIIAGLIIDFIIVLVKKDNTQEKIEDICEKEHCHCEESIVKSAIKHTVNITIFIAIITLIINILITIIGEEMISRFISNKPILGPIIAGIIGLIPNCASSVITTKLYIENIINVSTLLSGLFVSAGVGLAVLFKTNKNIKENIKVISLLYIIGVSAGIILQLAKISI